MGVVRSAAAGVSLAPAGVSAGAGRETRGMAYGSVGADAAPEGVQNPVTGCAAGPGCSGGDGPLSARSRGANQASPVPGDGSASQVRSGSGVPRGVNQESGATADGSSSARPASGGSLTAASYDPLPGWLA